MRAALLCLGMLLGWAGQAMAEPPPPPSQPTNANQGSSGPLNLEQLQTDDLRLLYFVPQETYLAPYLAHAFENSFAAQRRNFHWTPWEKTTILLKDFSDYGNAAARAVPRDSVLIDVAPVPQTFETFTAGEHFFTLMNHEMVHVATMDVWNEQDAWWRHLFHGKPMPVAKHPESILYNYLTTPRADSPRWYLEGSAVFMETWMSGGFGRAQGGYDEMVFRAMVRDNAQFFNPVSLESVGVNVDFQVGVNDYLYGTRFMSYLAYTFSPEKVLEWLRRGPDSAGYYSAQFERVFGKPLNDAWDDWIKFEHEFQRTNLASVSKYPLTPKQKLVNRALGSVSRSFYDPKSDTLIGGFRYPGVVANIGALSLKDSSIRRLAWIKGPMFFSVVSIAYDPESNKLWYAPDNKAYRDLVEIDVKTGESKTLIEDSRVGNLVFNPRDKSLWGIRHLNGLVTLVRIPPPYTSWNQIYTFHYGQVLFDPDISPDGELFSVAFGEINGDQTERVYRIEDLMNGEVKEVAKFGLGASQPEGFVFSSDGRYLYGTAFYTGVSNIYRYELATGKVDAVSNADTGFFRPIPRADGSLIVFEYTGAGLTPVVIDPEPLTDLGTIKFLGTETIKKHPELKDFAVGSPAKIPLDSMITGRGSYSPLHEMQLGTMYPVVEGYKGHGALGYHVIVEDPLELYQFFGTISYSPSTSLHPAERWHVDLDFHTLNWRFRYWHNDADFYDLFGPIERARKGDAFFVAYHNPLIFDPPRTLDLDTDAAYYTGLDTLPSAQNIHAQGIDKDIFEVNVALKYSNTETSLGAVDHEQGYLWDIKATEDYSHGESFPQIRAGFDFGFALPWQHSSLWLYSAAGAAGGDASDPLGYFYFGSFENNFVDDREVKHYRQFDSFPGFDIDEISARNFARSVLEWNLPPIRFENVGTPGFFLSSMRPALFTGVLLADTGDGNRTLETAGLQLDWNFTIALRLPMVFSVGYAAGIENGSVRRHELMASLKVL